MTSDLPVMKRCRFSARVGRRALKSSERKDSDTQQVCFSFYFNLKHVSKTPCHTTTVQSRSVNVKPGEGNVNECKTKL